MAEEYIRKITVLGEVPSLGPVVLYDDIEGLFKWTGGGTGGDQVAEKSTTVAFNGSACIHTKTRTTNAAADDKIYVRRLFYQRPGRRYRIELIWKLAVNANCKMLTFRSGVFDGTLVHNLRIMWDPQNNKWVYWNSGGVATDVPGGAQNLVAGNWHRVTLEWDESAKKYSKLISDSLEIDLSALSYYTNADASGVGMSLDLEIVAQSTSPPEAYFDDVLVLEI